MKFLENLKENSHGKKKKYIGEMERTLSKTENKYADRMEKALRDCEEILCPFLKYYYRDDQSDDLIEDICARMNQLRKTQRTAISICKLIRFIYPILRFWRV